MERTYARAILLAGASVTGAGFIGFALFEALRPLLGAVAAGALVGALFLAPAVALALRERKPAPVLTAANKAMAATEAQLHTLAQTAADNPLTTAATSALSTFAGVLDPRRRRE
ncbi:hypothetical protein [Zavarzinia aquatilis]|uniref:Uncharacterized protein n=1 Tax=Zavarzinia aquatilis TaxID=2211142 RepID=A0A317DV94_9PROT|nr:hypothetical protein [Zavarzinia aquatilis]PWR18481.1 hypothetical protein DKG74_18845 [Zavarzinia aquatilis]